MKLKLNKSMPQVVKLFRQVPDFPSEQHVMRQMRGNPKSRVMLIAPPSTMEEYEHGLPFCNDAAKEFHNILLGQVDIDTQRDLLVVSCSRYGLKPCKHSTDVIKDFIKNTARAELFDFYICVGEDAFKFIFGAGKKPASSTLFGSTVFCPETNRKPLFTFPSVKVLAPVMGGSDWENRKATQLAEQFNVKFSKLAIKMVKSMKQWTTK